jgi:1-deoxy-D-xylulose-5-phosphate reductoisomerase
VALANKETLVMAGELMTAQAHVRGARLLPIDSEHCALHQCLDGRTPDEVRRLVLTASGGPFRNRPQETFDAITREEALHHPTWNMGKKITIDSATLMNKGLEVIEARWLFGVTADRIEILVHPQSIVHSMVEFVDGTVLAQLGVTDAAAISTRSYPDRPPPSRDDFPRDAPGLSRPREVPARSRHRPWGRAGLACAANEEAVSPSSRATLLTDIFIIECSKRSRRGPYRG